MTQNTDAVNRFLDEVQTQGHFEVIYNLLSPDFIDHGARPGVAPGADGVRRVMQELRASLPDLEVVVLDQLEQGDKVVTRKVLSGTHSGDLLGVPATGRLLKVDTIDIVRVEDGKLVERWGLVDQLGLLRQLGVTRLPV